MPGEEDDKKKKDQENWFMSMLSKLNPFGGGGFDLGSILMMMIFVPVIYKVLNNDTVQGWIGKMFNDKDGQGGKEKVHEWFTGINAWIEDKAPWLAKLMGL